MERVLIVCGAGASSTFLALRIRAVARERGLDLVVEAGTLPDLDERLPATDVVLVGPHLAERFHTIASTASGTRIALLPDDVFGQGGAEAATDLVSRMLAEPEPTLEVEKH